MKQKRKRYTKEFKDEAVKLVTEQGYRISEAARNLGINENMLGKWKRQLREKQNGGSETNDSAAMTAEIKRLQKENKRLQMEREILKKAAAFFANEKN